MTEFVMDHSAVESHGRHLEEHASAVNTNRQIVDSLPFIGAKTGPSIGPAVESFRCSSGSELGSLSDLGRKLVGAAQLARGTPDQLGADWTFLGR